MFLLSCASKSGNLAHLHVKYFIFIIYKLILTLLLALYVLFFCSQTNNSLDIFRYLAQMVLCNLELCDPKSLSVRNVIISTKSLALCSKRIDCSCHQDADFPLGIILMIQYILTILINS